MKSLKDTSGLDIKLKEETLLYSSEFEVTPQPRLFSETKSVYLAETDPEYELYYMYRYFEKKIDADIFVKADTEYDITVIKPGKIGTEFIKTKGHYHALVPNTNLSYPEVYEIIEGEIEYLIQTRPNDKKETEVVIIKAKKGDKIVVPPGYGHVSINVGSEVAVSSNIQKRDLPAGADYGGFEYFHGGAMYRTEAGWIKNPEYTIKSVKYVKPKEKPEWQLHKNRPLYQSFVDNPESFDFVTRPQNYDFSDVWEAL